MYKLHNNTCRACGGTDLVSGLSLGVQPLANDFRRAGQERAGMAPLQVLYCKTCTLAQLSVVVNPDILYDRYSYRTSRSETMRAHFEDILDDILEECRRQPKTLLEIGSNDGTFLFFASKEFTSGVSGIEPARNLAADARANGILTTDRLFCQRLAIELAADGVRPDVIVARHVFCHVDDWRDFIKGLESVSHKHTLVFIEVPHVLDMFKNNSFDQIYHEHLSYMSTTAMRYLLKDSKFSIVKVNRYPIHGGAVGMFLKFGRQKLEKIASEENLFDRWIDLSGAMAKNTVDLMERVIENQRSGLVTCGFGASAKASVWINACGFTSRDIAFVCDSTPEKQGCFIPGTDIPIVPESELSKADFGICFAWNFLSEITAKNKAFTDKGGKWIVPCPTVEVLP